jgi:hypothetical protein
MAPFFWRFQAREATGRPSQLPSCARSKAIQADIAINVFKLPDLLKRQQY